MQRLVGSSFVTADRPFFGERSAEDGLPKAGVEGERDAGLWEGNVRESKKFAKKLKKTKKRC